MLEIGTVIAVVRIPTDRSIRLQGAGIAGFLGILLAAFVFLNMSTSVAWAASGTAEFTAGEVKAMHGAWQLRCGRPPGAQKEKCALVQNVKAQDRPNIALMVIFMRSYDGKTRILRIFAPLGVLLPRGLGLKVDNADVGNVQFMKCGTVGCMAEAVVDDELFNKLKGGTNAVFIIFQSPEAGIGIPISLTGFADGINALN
jgi:invasion protein IalB